MAPVVAPAVEVASSSRRGTLDVARDLFALTKPRVTTVVLVTAAGGMKLAHGKPTLATWLYTMLGTALIVGSANALNMYLERDVDGKMERTRNRPLPAGRMQPAVAIWFGVALAVVSLPILTLLVNPMTAFLAAVALVSYVLLYTPMKRHSVRALWVGAVPGAIPALLGYTAVRGRLDWVGIALFTIQFIWQIPHFLAISIFRASDYERAGLKVVPVEKGDGVTNRMMVRYSIALVAASLWPYFLGIGGRWYLGIALALGATWMVVMLRVFRASSRIRFARSMFAFSIIYLVALFGSLVALGS